MSEDPRRARRGPSPVTPAVAVPAEGARAVPQKRTITTTTLVFALLCGNAVVMYIDRTNMAIAAPLIQRSFGLDNVSLGFAFSTFSIAYAALMVAGGRLGDRIGARLGLTICGVIWAAGTFMTGLAGGLLGLAAARLLVGTGEAAVYPISSSVIGRWIPEHWRGFAQGTLHGCGRLGAAVTPFAVTALILAFSWRIAFLILGVASLLVSAVILAYLRDDPRQHPLITRAELARLGHHEEAPDPAFGSRPPPLAWADFFRRVWPVTAISFCYGWFSWFLLSWVPLYFTHVHGLNLKHVALFSTLVLIAGVLGEVCGGLATDARLKRIGDARRARRDIVIAAFLAAMLCILPLLFTANLLADTIFLALSYFMVELADSSIWMLGMEVLPSHTATSTATVNTGFALAGAVSPLVVGWLLDVTGGRWSDVFMVSIVVLLLGPVAACLPAPAQSAAA
ncbi:MAG TPA: MFS transporter [Acetobacteraceae bacterium]|nr:MFS transporter [Acetobacteraceae bacterium]